MTEREKIINIIEQNKGCDVNTTANCKECKYDKELVNYKGVGCSSLRIADALIAAGFGDVTKWKERAEKEKTEKNKWKCTANDWKQRFESREKQLAELRTTSCEAVIRKDRVISERKSEIDRLSTERDEYKHRAEVVEKDLQRHKRALKDMCEEYEDDIECELYKECDSNKPCYLCDYTVRLQQAEREIEEERGR